jgi:membrane protease YdiL (CAAX protease family)
VLAVPFILAIGPWLLRLPGLLGFQGFERGFAQVNTVPLGALIVGVVVVGTCEEILYRGIGYSLHAEIVGPVLAIILASTAFMIAHIPLWGIGHSLTTGLSGAAFTAFYALSGDLWANVLAHITIDLAGLIYPRLVRGGSGVQES